MTCSTHTPDAGAVSPRILPCPVPWCRGEGITVINDNATDGQHAVECLSCGASTPGQDTQAKAVEIWNSRPNEDEHRKKLLADVDHTRYVMVRMEATLMGLAMLERENRKGE